MGIMSGIFGSESKVKQESLLRKSQGELVDQSSEFLSEGLARGATESKYAAYAETPDILLDAFSRAQGMMGFGQDEILQALMGQAQGQAAYTYDPGQITKDWKANVAKPMMQAYEEYVQPLVKKSYNLPGMLHSSVTSRGMSEAAGQYFAQNVAPSLYGDLQTGQQRAFQSGEAAAGRQLGAAQMLGSAPMVALSGQIGVGNIELAEQSRILAAMRGEESRLMPELNPYLSPAMSLGTAKTMENVVMQGEQGMLSSALGMGASAMAMGGMGMIPGLGGMMETGMSMF